MNIDTNDIGRFIDRRGVMLVLSSPSGAGKSTIAQELLIREPELELSVSVTTRKQRDSEINGTHYHFISQQEFKRMRDSNLLLEWAEVHGNFYGTPASPVRKILDNGKDTLFDVDWQGSLQLMEKARADVVSIFILPPSMEELKLRLKRRAEDALDVIAQRLDNAFGEIPHWHDYDYIIINKDLERSFTQVRSILQAERLRRDRWSGLSDFIKELVGKRSSC